MIIRSIHSKNNNVNLASRTRLGFGTGKAATRRGDEYVWGFS